MQYKYADTFVLRHVPFRWQQAITWTNVFDELYSHTASRDVIELK